MSKASNTYQEKVPTTPIIEEEVYPKASTDTPKQELSEQANYGLQQLMIGFLCLSFFPSVYLIGRLIVKLF